MVNLNVYRYKALAQKILNADASDENQIEELNILCTKMWKKNIVTSNKHLFIIILNFPIEVHMITWCYKIILMRNIIKKLFVNIKYIISTI